MKSLAAFASAATFIAGAASAQVNMQPLSIVPAIQARPAPIAAKPVRPTPPLPPPRPAFEAPSTNAATSGVGATAPVISGSVPIPAPALAPTETRPVAAQVEIRVPESKPVEAKPVEAKPVEAKPVETKPVETKPVETKPVETKPVETKPVETKAPIMPPEAKPAEIAPATTRSPKPIDARPVEARPLETKIDEQKPAEKHAATTLSFAGAAPAPEPPPPVAAQAQPQVAFRPRNEAQQPGMVGWMYGATTEMAGQIWSGARDQAARLLWSSDPAPTVRRDELFRQAMAQAGFDVENATTEGFLVSYETIVFVARRQATQFEREKAVELGAELAKLGGLRNYIEQAALRRALEPPAPGALPLQRLEIQLWPYPWIKSVLGPLKQG